MKSAISGIAYALPNNILTNEQLADEFNRWKPEKIKKKTGIASRRYVNPEETALDLGEQACHKLFETHSPDDVDYILFCTQSPDHYLPGNACMLQQRLGLHNTLAAVDYNLGCSGYVAGLSLARGLIAGGIAKNVLLVTGETYTKHINEKDLANRTIFGDAASATIVRASEDSAIHAFAFGTDGRGAENLIVRNGGLRHRYDPAAPEIEDDAGNIHTDNDLVMNGPEIFNFTIQAVPVLVQQVLEANDVEIDDLDFVIFHQANKFILEYLRKIIAIPEDKFYLNMETVGNTVSSTIPIALYETIAEKKVRAGDKVMLIGFGVGYSWAGTIITITDDMIRLS